MTRVAIVRPPIDEQPGQQIYRGFPLGPLALAAWLRRERSDDIRVLDYHLNPDRLDRFPEDLTSFEPEVIAFSAYSVQGPAVHGLIAQAKSVCPDRPVVVGGPYATASPLHLFDDPNIDFAIIGDGEVPFRKLLDLLEAGRPAEDVPGVAFRDTAGRGMWDGRHGEISDLDCLPLLAYDIVDAEAYFSTRTMGYWEAHERRVPMLTTRGCIFRCSYCFHMHGNNFQQQSPERVMQEISHLVDTYGAREIQFYDDCFNAKRDNALAILKSIADSDLNLRLAFPPGLRGELLDSEFIHALKNAGTYQICVPIDVVEPRHQEYVNRTMDVRKTLDAIRLADRAGLITVTNLILGFPGETREEMERAITLACSSRAHLATFVFLNVFSKTDLYEKVRRDYPEYEITPYGGNWQSTRFNLSELSDDELLDIASNATARFHLSPWRLWRLLWLLPRKAALFHFVRLFFQRVFRTA